MFKSIRSKLVFLISVFIVIIFTTSSYFIINSKYQQGLDTVNQFNFKYIHAVSNTIYKSYLNYLDTNDIKSFKKDLDHFLLRSNDFSKVSILNKKGEEVFNTKDFMVSDRKVNSKTNIILRVNNVLPSINTDNDTVYSGLDKDYESIFPSTNSIWTFMLVNKRNNIEEVIVPFDKYALYYEFDYTNLIKDLNITRFTFLLLTLYSVLIGITIIYFFADNLTRPLHKLSKKVKEIAKGDFSVRTGIHTEDEVGQLSQSIDEMTIELKNSTDAKMYEQRTKKELELAAKIQKDFLPKEIPKFDNLDIAATTLPASQVGGDGYDIIPVDLHNTLLYLGDATGHGVSAGLVVSIINSIVYSHRNLPLDDILIRTNGVLHVKTPTNVFFTMMLMNWNDKTKVLKSINAGHEKLIIYRKATNSVELFDQTGLALGMFEAPPVPYQERDIHLEIGDIVFIYTDGIPEARNPDGEMYEIEKLKDTVYKCCNSESGLGSALSIKNAIFADTMDFINGSEQLDDISLMVIKRTK